MKRVLSNALTARLAGAVIVLATWEIVVPLAAPAYVATPSGIVAAAPAALASATMLDALGVTLLAVLEGVAIAMVLGIIVGLAMGQLRWLERLVRLYVEGLYATPMVAVLPLVTIWMGYTGSARLATIVFAAFFPFAMNAFEGSRSVPREFTEVARSYRAGWVSLWFGIALPSSLPYLLAGLRLAVGRALVGAIIAEFFLSVDGIGYYILFNTRSFQHNKAFVAVILLALVAVAVDWGTEAATHRFLPWFRRARA
jgi:ABC-type nitrate/sulfonate/bicarbonate transport system permease component